MSLENLRKKVIFQNTLDIWIELCKEKNIQWEDHDKYGKFVEYLKNQNLSLKNFPLCVTEADSPENQKKVNFSEIIKESTDPNSETYTIKLSDSNMAILRNFVIS